MKTEIENAIKTLVKTIDGDIESDDALRITQAAVNLAHVLVRVIYVESERGSYKLS